MPDNVYVTNRGSNNVSVVDITTNTVLTTTTVGTRPLGIAVTPNGDYVYLVNTTSDNVTVIETTGYTVYATVAVGTQPWDVAIDPTGTTAYVTNSGSANVTPITIATNTPQTPIALPGTTFPEPIAITPNGLTAYVGDLSAGGQVFPITLATQIVGTPIPANSDPTGIAITPDNQYAYVSCGAGGTIEVLNCTSNTHFATITPLASFGQPDGVAITTNGLYCWVAGSQGAIDVITISSNTITATISIAPGDVLEGIGMTPDGLYAYVADLSGGALFPVTLLSGGSNGSPGTAISVGTQPWGVGIAPATVATGMLVMIV